MPRKLRVEYPGAIYHVMHRGDRRESIFRDEEDRKLFLLTLGQCCGKTDWQVHAWCLMPNHFHLVVETPRANLVARMKWFLGTYTARFNRLRIPTKSDTCSNSNRTLIPIDVEKVSVNGIDIFLTGCGMACELRVEFARSCWPRWPSDAESGTMGRNCRRAPKSGRRG